MPAVSVPCPRCSTPVPVPADAAGGRPLSCPRCQAVVRATSDAPDFSHLRNQADLDDDILVAEDATDGESVMELPTVRPTKPTTTVNKPTPRPAPVVYTPPAAAVQSQDPFAHLADTGPNPPLPRRTPDAEPTVRAPKWVLPTLLALAAYAVVATGFGVWGWVRPVAPTVAPAK